MPLTLPQIIEKKAKREALSTEDIETIVKAAAQNTMDPAQIGAFLMAVYINDMNDDECACLTTQMGHYGDSLDFSKENWAKRVVDKHSTGGVGDKISLLLTPALAACGCKVPMISGRSLGFTGGTLDKLESIPGYTVEMTLEKMKKTIEDTGAFISGQTANIAPVDKKFYSIRDVSGTVSSIPLIVSSIMSKKLIEGLRVLLLDVKVGHAALMKHDKEASSLAKRLIKVGQKCGVNMVAFLTRMDHPIGHGIGNALEVADALRGLNNLMADDLRELVVKEAGMLLYMSDLAHSFDDGQKKIEAVIENGKALQKFKEILISQGVAPELADKLCNCGDHPLKYYLQLLNCDGTKRTELKAEDSGVITDMKALEIAEFTQKLGAGRKLAADKIDHAVGIYLQRKVGEEVNKGDTWAEIFHRNPFSAEEIKELQSYVVIAKADKANKRNLLIKVIAK